MEKFSEWNKIDLHIHSKKSSEVKDNDYDGSEYTASQLLNVLTSDNNRVNIFSITDHNCLNKKLYNDLNTEITREPFKDKIDFIVGVELDVLDSSIYDDVFHCLCFFDTKDIEVISKSIDEIFDNAELKDRNDKNIYPDVNKIFRKFANNNIQNILLIPHFNNKTKGLPSNIAIEHLNYLCFNAYEDANNIKNIQKSLKIYKEAGYDNFPFAVFTDNHNLSIYPKDKNGNDNEIKCWVLGNISEPFNAIKTAFQEPKMRIHLSSIEGMRKITYPQKYIDHIFIGGKEYGLSPYQNTIVGKFGSGKSLLLHKIKLGSENLKNDDKYRDFYNENENSKVCVGAQKFNSLSELSENNFKIYEFIQQEDYYYKNVFTLDNAKKLFKQLNIEHEFNEDIKFVFDETDINNSFKSIKQILEKTDGKNNLNYERAFDSQNYFYFNTTYGNTDMVNIRKQLSDSYEYIKDIDNLSINDIELFTEAEKGKIKDVKSIISEKKLILDKYIQTRVESKLQKILSEYNNIYINNNAKNLKDTLLKDISDFRTKLKKFYNDSNKFELIFPKSKYDECTQIKYDTLINNYSISWKYTPESDYRSIIDELIKASNQCENLFKSVLKTLINSNDKNFASNKDFKYHIDKYVTYANTIFTSKNIKYDILKNNDSLLRKSAGEKSSLFIEFIFDLLEKDLTDAVGILLILDQPEDNIDNDNVFNQISKRLRELKYKYNNFQSIIVTHNANVAIAADSENIIIANEKLDSNGNKNFEYSMGCIENKEYIENVCKILEGGRQAMEKRTIKYGINIIRKVNEDGI